jgi:hypothetical protein
VLARRERHQQLQLDVQGLAERAPPTADDLAIDHDDVSDEPVHAVVRPGGEQPLGDGAAVAEADDVLVEVRQQMGHARRVPRTA